VAGYIDVVEPGAVRLLVVDDDVALCNMLASGLAHTGYQVMTANDIDDALARTELTPPDVAIVDLGMPKGSGMTVIRDLKARAGAAIHVVVLTGNDDESSRATSFEAGADDYILKPVVIAEVQRRIAAAIKKQRAYVQVRLEKEAAERRLVYGQEAAALLAHDLNNGLTVSLSNLSFVLDVIECDAEQKDALETTLRAMRRMSSLVANFVDIARFEDAAVKPLVQQTSICQLLQSVLEVNRLAVRSNVSVEIDCSDDLEGRLDGGLIERVLHNLFGNASRYCPQGGRITLSGRRWHDTGSVVLAVTNDGQPVPEAIRSKLFEKYVQGKGGKRGMGLYFCRLVVEAHGGRIDYELNAQRPSFVVRLPGRA